MSSSQKNIKINDSHETRIALLEQSIGHIGQTLLRLESKIDNLDSSLNSKINNLDKSLNSRIDNLDKSLGSRIDNIDKSLNSRIDKIDNKLWQIMFLISSSVIGVILGKIFHWF